LSLYEEYFKELIKDKKINKINYLYYKSDYKKEDLSKYNNWAKIYIDDLKDIFNSGVDYSSNAILEMYKDYILINGNNFEELYSSINGNVKNNKSFFNQDEILQKIQLNRAFSKMISNVIESNKINKDFYFNTFKGKQALELYKKLNEKKYIYLEIIRESDSSSYPEIKLVFCKDFKSHQNFDTIINELKVFRHLYNEKEFNSRLIQIKQKNSNYSYYIKYIKNKNNSKNLEKVIKETVIDFNEFIKKVKNFL